MKLKIVDWAYYCSREFYKTTIDYESILQFREPQDYVTIRLAI